MTTTVHLAISNLEADGYNVQFSHGAKVIVGQVTQGAWHKTVLGTTILDVVNKLRHAIYTSNGKNQEEVQK